MNHSRSGLGEREILAGGEFRGLRGKFLFAFKKKGRVREEGERFDLGNSLNSKGKRRESITEP